MKLSRIAIAALCAITIVGCKSSQKSTSTSSSTATVSIAEIAKASTSQRYAMLEQQYKDWTDVSVPINAEWQGLNNVNMGGRVKMVRGKSIEFSFRMFGFEMAKIYIDNDSAYASVKPYKRYFAEPVSALSSVLPLTLTNLQDMLIGQMFVLGENSIQGNQKKFDLSLENGNMIATPKTMPNGIEYGFVINNSNNLERLAMTIAKSSFEAVCNYSGITNDTQAGPVAGDFELKATYPKNEVGLYITWNWSSATWNSGVAPSWETPSGYRKMNAAELIKNL
jgi:hypothetical protein